MTNCFHALRLPAKPAAAAAGATFPAASPAALAARHAWLAKIDAVQNSKVRWHPASDKTKSGNASSSAFRPSDVSSTWALEAASSTGPAVSPVAFAARHAWLARIDAVQKSNVGTDRGTDKTQSSSASSSAARPLTVSSTLALEAPSSTVSNAAHTSPATPATPSDLQARMKAMEKQVCSLWELNNSFVPPQSYKYLSDAIDNATAAGLLSHAQTEELRNINRAGNKAKHENLGPSTSSSMDIQ